MAAKAPPETRSTWGSAAIWLVSWWPRLELAAARVTIMPVAEDMRRAGIWVTSPSPTVSRV